MGRQNRVPLRSSSVGSVSILVVASTLLAGLGFTAQTNSPAVASVPSFSDGVLGQWSQLGERSDHAFDWLDPGLNNAVYGLASDGTYLYAGGLFDGPGGPTTPATDNRSDCSDDVDDPVNPLNCIARIPLNAPTSAWQPLGAGLNNQVDDMVVMPDGLYVGGKFDDEVDQGDMNCSTRDNSALNCLAKWSDNSWNALPGGSVRNDPAIELDESTLATPKSGEVPTGAGIGGTFVAARNGELTSLKLKLSGITSGTTLTVSIHGVFDEGPDGFIPAADPLARHSVVVTGASVDGIQVVEFADPATLVGGTVYAFVLSSNVVSGTPLKLEYTGSPIAGTALVTRSGETWVSDSSKAPLFGTVIGVIPDDTPLTRPAASPSLNIPSKWQAGGTFKASTTGDLTALKLKLSDMTHEGSLTVSIFAAMPSGLPIGNPIATGTIVFPRRPAETTLVTLAARVGLTAGFDYAFVLASDVYPDAPPLKLQYTNASRANIALLKTSSGTLEADTAKAPIFETIVDGVADITTLTRTSTTSEIVPNSWQAGGSFVSARTGQLKTLKVVLDNFVTSKKLTVSVFAARPSGFPSDNLLATASVDGPFSATSPPVITFTSPPGVYAGDRYAFVLSSNADSDSPLELQFTDSPPTGTALLTKVNGVWTRDSARVPRFETIVDVGLNDIVDNTTLSRGRTGAVPISTRALGGDFTQDPDRSGLLSRLTLQFEPFTLPGKSLTVDIYSLRSGSSGSEPDRRLATQTVSLNGPLSVPGQVAVDFVRPATVLSSSQYRFVLTSDAAPPSLKLEYIDIDPVSGFSLATKIGETWTSDPTKVPLFDTYIDASSDVLALSRRGTNTLVVAGGFSTAGTLGPDALDGLAEWSSGTWSQPGTGGFSSMVNALATDGSTAYVGGGYEGELIGGVIPRGITRTTGSFSSESSWSDMGGGFRSPGGRGRIDALALLGGTVYAGGLFSAPGAGTGTLNNLAKWTGTEWQSVGPGLNRTVTTSIRALATDEERGLLYVGGTFNNSTSNVANYPCLPVIPGPSPSSSPIPNPDGQGPLRCVAVWDTGLNQFIPFRWGTDVNDNGVTGEVSSFVVSGRDVYVGGNFNTNAQGAWPYQWNLKNVGKWTWDAPVGTVNASASSGDSLTITGEGFIGVKASGGVKLGGVEVTYTRTSSTSIMATVPCDLASGNHTISVNGVGGWGSVGTVAVTQRSCGGVPAPTASSTSSPTPLATPTIGPTATGPTVEQLRAVGQVRPDRVPALSKGVPPGKAIVLADGRVERNTLKVWSQGMTDRAGPVTMTVRTRSTRGVNQTPVDGSLSIPQWITPTRERGSSLPGIQLNSSGNAALTPVRVFLIPQPKSGPRGVRAQDLGYLMTDAQGRLQGKVLVQARKAGAYIVQINGRGVDGLVRSINLPARVRR